MRAFWAELIEGAKGATQQQHRLPSQSDPEAVTQDSPAASLKWPFVHLSLGSLPKPQLPLPYLVLVESGRDRPSHVVFRVPISNAFCHRQAKASLIKPSDIATIHVPQSEKVGVGRHHPEEKRLNFINPANALGRHALRQI